MSLHRISIPDIHSGLSSSSSTSSTSSSSNFHNATACPCGELSHGLLFFFDSFDIYGIGWDPDLLHESDAPGSGNGLLERLRGCSVVTGWTFTDLTSDASSPWQFHASGRTTIWQKKCIGHAMVSAGAPSGSGCSGSS